MNLNEGLAYEDLKGLVGSEISIDQYKPKIGEDEDTVVVAFTVTYEDPAKDLSNFIESGDLAHLDVDISSAPEPDGSYKVFIEFQRDLELFDKINDMVMAIDQITSKEEQWTYTAFKVKGAVELTKENFKRDIIDSKVEYRKLHKAALEVGAVNESVLARIQYLTKYKA